MDKGTIIKELKFKAIRSSGAGGQHVNKVSSKVELLFDVEHSLGLTNLEKERLYIKLANKLSNENMLLLQCDESRSQHKNKDLVIKRLFEVLKTALKVPKKRKKTKPSKSAIEKRLKSKQKRAQKKVNRQKPNLD
ncbi:ribosome-associated protein [Saonia flava]|uniref:Ribosome-associated protein n=1 Tax=Saonia flava TaxID=523696 RepID=A0A846QQV5_9FLAO|nr:alternative ribosome rescue aminoacyl-tRNA hydrolase ArfB [Saonia flava]NJB71406.1 ribosome-associated protein [Saonia flava]